jgi:phosphatidylethanolamine/phosphatidyl-N-methylethanolamine N-methyltransferase
MAGIWSNYRVFIRQFFQRYHTTGAILPSGRPLASALCRYVRDGDGDAREILEVGPGTGAVTARLVQLLRPDDRLTLVELNDDFIRHLNERFASEADFKAVRDRCHLVHSRLEDLDGAGHYDRIVSGLPLNNFASAEVQQILETFARLAKPGGILSFFEYVAVRKAKRLVSGRSERQRLNEIGDLLDTLSKQHGIHRDCVLLNVTPAWVHHVRFGNGE